MLELKNVYKHVASDRKWIYTGIKENFMKKIKKFYKAQEIVVDTETQCSNFFGKYL